ncbi:hypothetical protein ACHAXS_014303 [Conticribra weissflogii]
MSGSRSILVSINEGSFVMPANSEVFVIYMLWRRFLHGNDGNSCSERNKGSLDGNAGGLVAFCKVNIVR